MNTPKRTRAPYPDVVPGSPPTHSRRQVLGLLGGAIAAAAVACTDQSGTEGQAPSTPSSVPATTTTTTAPTLAGDAVVARPGPPSAWTGENLGMNLAWLNDHAGNQRVNFLSDGWDEPLLAADLDLLVELSITKLRAFCPLEAVMAYEDGAFTLDRERADHLHWFLDEAAERGIAVYVVMGDGHVNRDVPTESLDGKFRWELVVDQAGLDVYTRAFDAYIKEFVRHTNVAFWEIHNEPYANLTWSSWPQSLGITPEATHLFLKAVYDVLKPSTGAVPVGFSDLEEEEQDKYRLYSQAFKFPTLIDDCTDVYALHIYRGEVAQLHDFTGLTGKPKWVLELGDYNYDDPTGLDHNDQPANGELYDEKANAATFRTLGEALMAMGFELFMPWSIADNQGMVEHRPDGSHTVKTLPRWMAGEILAAS
jgi:hypothetical protein